MTYTNVTEKKIYLRFPSSHFLPGAAMKPFFVILQIHGVNEDFSALQLGLPDDARYDNTQLEPVLERFGMYHEWRQLQQLSYPMPVDHLMYLMVEAGLVKRLKSSRMRGSEVLLD
ncbi:hypothetical protein MKQ70_04835 [Chitinophaga sedimenti]|uniref:hypothetical protein n=1 Tax=Chitinophaga sedimenti TaxID=2033606 RepID=UPI0020045EF5|nr:hypothetical protein [Chitinophaga sedimenti]MCK7554367.1 hypothetical protein [Chitinophaga sedimenti]